MPGADVEIRLLGPGDEALLAEAGDAVFDGPVDPDGARGFLAAPLHRIAAALVAGRVVGFASGVRHVHPDKPWALWISEVGVAEAYRRRGIASAVVERLLADAAADGCVEAWVAADVSNGPARALYASLGAVTEGEDAVVMVFPAERMGGTR